MDIAPLLSCTKNITQHKSLDLVKSHSVTLCHGLEKIYGMLILQIRARFFRSPPTTETVSPFFLARLPFFARSQLPRESPLFFLARPPFSLAPNYRESLPFFSSLARFTESVPNFFFLARPLFFVRPQLQRESSLFFPRSPAFFVRPQLPREFPPFFLARPPFSLAQLPRAWNRLSENLQRSCLFSTQCLRIEKSVLLEFDRDQYYVLPK